MCLILNEKDYATKPLMATKDIKCWKILEKNNTSPFYSSFKYKKGVVNKSKLGLYHGNMVEEGFHSMKSFFPLWLKCLFEFEWGCKVKRFIIPKGSYYYVGKWGSKVGYASDQIIMK